MKIYSTEFVEKNVLNLSLNPECKTFMVSGVSPQKEGLNLLHFQYKYIAVPRAVILLKCFEKKVDGGELVTLLKIDDVEKRLDGISFYLELAQYDTDNNLIEMDRDECVFLSDYAVQLAEDYSHKTQNNYDYSAIYSSERFYHSLKTGVLASDSLNDKVVFLSGYGLGSEISNLLCCNVGKILAYDSNKTATSLAEERFKYQKKVCVIHDGTTIPTKEADFVISRHVIEHITEEMQSKYLSDLTTVVKDDGAIILEFPNGEHPIDPHTEIMFFHLLPKNKRNELLQYFSRTNIISSDLYNTLKSVSDLNMPSLNSIKKIIPSSWKIKDMQFKDSFSEMADVIFPKTIELKIVMDSKYLRQF
jgi:hypothetical protein